MISSAYIRIESSSVPLYFTPHFILLISCIISLDNRLNNNGDRIQPCLNPVVTLNHSLSIPFTRTEHHTDRYSDFKARIIGPLIPRECNFFHKRLLFTLSYALEKSTNVENV